MARHWSMVRTSPQCQMSSWSMDHPRPRVSTTPVCGAVHSLLARWRSKAVRPAKEAWQAEQWQVLSPWAGMLVRQEQEKSAVMGGLLS